MVVNVVVELYAGLIEEVHVVRDSERLKQMIKDWFLDHYSEEAYNRYQSDLEGFTFDEFEWELYTFHSEIEGDARPISEIEFTEDILIMDILDEYVTDMEPIPTEEGKKFFRDWSGQIPAKLIRQSIFAGVLFALKHPEKIQVKRK